MSLSRSFSFAALETWNFLIWRTQKGFFFRGRGVVVHSNGATINLDQIARGHHHKEEKERTNHK